MMHQDESLALTTITRFKHELKLTVQQFRGEIIQYYGDGCLMIFTNSPVQ
jgi:hypothetical protein